MNHNEIKEIIRCRGKGKIYTLFECVAQKELFVSTETKSGNPTPSNATWLSDSELVIAVSDFKLTQLIHFWDGKKKKATFTVNPLHSLLESKANGLTNKTLCKKIRNIDYSGINCPALISCDEFIPNENGVIIRGTINGALDGTKIKVAALDSKGKQIGLGQPLFPITGREENTTFSLFVPNLESQTTICITNPDGSFSNSFYVLEPYEIRSLGKASKQAFINAFDDPNYEKWFAKHRLTRTEANMQRSQKDANGPKFSIIVPLYKTPINFFNDMVSSVIDQTYDNWELVLVNSTPEINELSERVNDYAQKDTRMVVVNLDKNYGITENTNRGIAVAKGNYICFFDHDDVLEPNILFEYAKAIKDRPETSLIYCDEDKLLPNGHYANPTFKPDFNLDMIRDNNYICHLLTVKKEALDSVELSDSSLDGAQDHAMVLKIAELGGYIHHVPKILYHWRISENSTAGNSDSKPYASIAGIKAVQDHLDRCNIKSIVVSSHDRAFRYRPLYEIPEGTKVSVVVPIQNPSNAAKLFEALAVTIFEQWELIIVCSDNDRGTIESIASNSPLEERASILGTEQIYAYSRWANLGANISSGNCFAFIKEYIEPQEEDWLTNMVGIAMRADVGAVGTMTCDPDGIIRQAGLTYAKSQIIQLSKGLFHDSFGYILLPLTTREVAAVAGACIVTSRKAFAAIGGFDDGFNTGYEDIDYCFEAKQSKLKVVYTPEARLVCTEPERLEYSPLNLLDKATFISKWSDVLSKQDCYFNCNLSTSCSRVGLYKLPN